MTTQLLEPESDYGSWENTAAEALEEASAFSPKKELADVWPQWGDGVPTYFRQWIEVRC